MTKFGLPDNKKWSALDSAEKFNYGAGIGMGAINLLGTVASNLTSNKDELNTPVPEVNSGSKADLASMIGSFSPYTYQKENAGLAGLSGLVSGAASGSAGGIWGAAGGAVIGGLSGLLGASARNRNARIATDAKNAEMTDNFVRENARLTARGLTDSLLNYAANGGYISRNGGTFSNKLVEFNAGNSHEVNPNGGVMQGIGANGKPNVVEEGEVRFNDFIFSNRINVDRNYVNTSSLPKNIDGKSYAKVAKSIGNESKERPFDPISNRTKNVLLSRLSNAQESQKELQSFENEFNSVGEELGLNKTIYAKGGKVFINNNVFKAGGSCKRNSYSIGGELGLFAPALTNLGTLLNVAGDSPEQVSIPRIRAGQRLNENLPYNPIDPNLLSARVSAQAGATRRGIMDSAGGNRGAAISGLLSADQSYLGATGDAFLKASEVNSNKLLQNAQFANQARQYNNQLSMQEQVANQQAFLQEWDINARNRAAKRSAISSGLQALAGNLSDTSRYISNKEMIENTFPYLSNGQFNPRFGMSENAPTIPLKKDEDFSGLFYNGILNPFYTKYKKPLNLSNKFQK